MPKGRINLVFFLGVIVGSCSVIVASIFLRENFVVSRAQAWGAQDVPFICLSNCTVVGPSGTNGPGFGRRFAGKDLAGAYINDFNSEGGNDFSKIILRGGYLPNFSSSPGDNWDNADFSNAWMQYANLNADFTDANFSGTDLSNATLNGNFTHANFSGAHLYNADLVNGTFTGANFSGVQWVNVTCPNGQVATTSGCDFTVPPTP